MVEGMFSLEHWTILAPLRKEQITLAVKEALWDYPKQREFGHAISGLKNFCVANGSFDAFYRLYIPSSNSENWALTQLNQALKKRKRPCPPFPLEKLPPELMISIYSHLHPADIVALGLCCQRLWMRALTAIHHYRYLDSWADTPLFITGDRLVCLPHAICDILPRLRRPSIERHDKPGDVADQRNPYMPDALAHDWNQNAMRHYACSTLSEFKPLGREELLRLLVSSATPESLHEPMVSCLVPQEADSEGQWYLRNSHAKQYIRMGLVKDESISKHITISMLGTPWLTLDILLVWLITWQAGVDNLPREVSKGNPADQVKEVFTNGSSIASLGMDQIRDCFKDMYNGRWAGHSLHVVKLVPTEIESVWTDITSEIEDAARGWFAGIYLESQFLENMKYTEYWRNFAKDQMEK